MNLRCYAGRKCYHSIGWCGSVAVPPFLGDERGDDSGTGLPYKSRTPRTPPGSVGFALLEEPERSASKHLEIRRAKDIGPAFEYSLKERPASVRIAKSL